MMHLDTDIALKVRETVVKGVSLYLRDGIDRQLRHKRPIYAVPKYDLLDDLQRRTQ